MLSLAANSLKFISQSETILAAKSWQRNATRNIMKLRKALLPLYIVSKILCINPLSLKYFRPSKFGTILTICQAVGYIVFHLWMVNRDMSTDLTKNLVRQLIDSYNRYSGFCAFCFLVVTSLFTQNKIVTVIKNIEDIDNILETKLNVPNANKAWRRYGNEALWFEWLVWKCYFDFHFRNVSLQICACIVVLSILEWRNCLMYIQDSVPFSEYCLVMCLGWWQILDSNTLFWFIYIGIWCNFSSNVLYWYDWDPIFCLHPTNPSPPSATQQTFNTFSQHSTFQCSKQSVCVHYKSSTR